MQSREVLYIIEILYWVPASIVSGYVMYVHGFSKQMGWYSLGLLSIFRIIGAITGILGIGHPSEGLYETTFICASIGLMALIGALSGLMLRVNMNMSEHKIITPQRAKIIHMPTLAATILSICAGTEIGNDRPKDVAQAILFFKIATGIITAVYLTVVLVTIHTVKHKRFALGSEQLFVKMAIFSIPFITIRLVFAWLSHWMPIGSVFWMMSEGITPTIIRAFMCVLEEFVVVSVFLYAGLVTDSASAPTRAALRTGHKEALIGIASEKFVGVVTARGRGTDVTSASTV